MTDFHSHILPGVDDGSQSVEMSIQMLRREAEQGITRVVATPHFYARHDDPQRFLRHRMEAEARLRSAMTSETGLPALVMGAEVLYFPGIGHCEALRELTIDGKDCVLIEMPLSPWTDSMYRELERIRSCLGLLPMIAHVDRYIRPLRTYGIPQKLAELPVVVQANSAFFRNRRTQKLAMRLIREGKIHALGSDCHDLDERAPNMEAAIHEIRRICGADALKRIQEFEHIIFRPDGRWPKPIKEENT